MYKTYVFRIVPTFPHGIGRRLSAATRRRFEGRVPVGYRENGSIRYKSVYARTLAEVKQKMAELYAVGQEKPVSSLKLTVKEAAQQWIISAKLRVKLSSYATI